MAESRPHALPPAERTVGQLVAETIRLYGANFWRTLFVGMPPAALTLISASTPEGLVLYAAPLTTGVLLAISYVYACTIVFPLEDRDRLVPASVAAFLTFAPCAYLVIGFILPALVWLAAFGLAVPAILQENRTVVDGFRRAFQLARAGFVHVLGGLATLAIVTFLTQTVLTFLLRDTADQALKTAFVVSEIVLSPLLFLGLALLYVDQRARVE